MNYSPYKLITKFIKNTGITEKKPFTRLCKATSIPVNKDFEGFKLIYKSENFKLHKPYFYLDPENQTNVINFLPAQIPSHAAGIITANNVFVSLPYPVHRWKGKVFIEPMRNVSKYLSEIRYLIALESIPFSRKKKLSESILLIMPSQDNYFHWIVETLPRLKMIEEDNRLNQLPLIVSKNRCPKFIKESLETLGLLPKTLFLEDGVYQFEKLHLLSLLSLPSYPSPLGVEWLRQKLIKEPITTKKRRIYISRKDASKRQTINESEVEECLSNFGFESHCMSQYSFEEQIKIFQEAEIIIGTHGAALANLVFAPSDTIFIELLNTQKANPCYYMLASIRNLKYGFLLCENVNSNLKVNIDDLRKLVEKTLTATTSL
ncbi:Capsular polysaccharide biosynthesis protein-like protein [Gloeothece citriformis PCC 7424]|uniref:Capsular polysaccharide biosynthesis protein-like protein n=1 Tax=Gloeothece citriformis (strain PCC 7424) TaxID=65393 RepID=B7KL62_GLOC7|nr:glycosyltransferase family 61 protein [Gloeothece citriformis]ACK72434.1 Capsular polysaccharide biosynthesis protein-like protein [Gloeothece citriformis PCC 7424]